MTGYVRIDVTDQIANGNTVDAIPLDQEFDAITSAFTHVSGHRHNGSVGEGAPITVVGPAQNVVVSSNSVTPSVDNFVDLGSTTNKFKDLWIDGVANIDSLMAGTADINAGTMDAVVIGATTPAAASVTTLSTTGAATLASATVGGVDATTATNTQTLTGKTFNLTDNTLVATSAQLRTAVTDETGIGALVFASSPTFTGIPLAPTPATNTNTTQVATTAYVVAQIANDAPTKTGTGATGSWNVNSATATALETPRTINGTLFSGTADITTVNWGTARTITIGPTSKSVNGSGNVAWTEAEVGIVPVPPGQIGWFAGQTAPTGWLKANGANVSRTTYANLFAEIGTVYGAGNGTTTFTLPDLRGAFARGWDDGRGLDPARAFGSYQADAMLDHTHSGTTSLSGSHTHTPTGGGAVLAGSAGPNPGFDPGSQYGSTNSGALSTEPNHTHTLTTGNPNIGGGTETRPKNYALLVCIKT